MEKEIVERYENTMGWNHWSKYLGKQPEFMVSYECILDEFRNPYNGEIFTKVEVGKMIAFYDFMVIFTIFIFIIILE